jgi:hypothetical protein
LTSNANANVEFPIPIPPAPLEGTDAADRARQQAFEALEYVFSEDEQQQQCQYVKCQNPSCSKKNKNIKIVGRLPMPKSGTRIQMLQKRLNYLERYPNGHHTVSADIEIKKTREELAQLEAEESQKDKLRHLPLYSSKCTEYRFFCSPCWDKAYLSDQNQRRKERMNE